MGEHVQVDRPQVLPGLAGREVGRDLTEPGDVTPHFEAATDTLGPTLNQSSQVQRLANLGQSMNAGPHAGGLVQLRTSLNSSSQTGVVQRADDLDLSDDAWLAKWYGKAPGKKSMTAARKYTQMLNTVLNEKKAAKGEIERRIDSVDWNDMRGALLSAIMSFQMHIAPYRPIGGQGYDRNMRGDVGGFYFRSNEHRYKDIYKRVAALVPEVADALAKNTNLQIVAPMNEELVKNLLPLAPNSADVRNLSKTSGVDLFETTKTYKQFPSLGVTQNNFILFDRAQELLNQHKDKLKGDKALSMLLVDDEGVSYGDEGIGRKLMQGDTEVTAQEILPELMQNLAGMSAPENNESFHDFMLRERGDTVDRLSAMVNASSVSGRYQAVGAEKHPSLILHELGTAPLSKKKQKTAVRNMETGFIEAFNKSGDTDPWQVKVAKRGSFGFARPTLSPVGQSERFWPGYAPDTLLAAGMQSALGMKKDEATLPPGTESGSSPVHVEALKAAVRHALIVLNRGGLNGPESGSSNSTAGLRDWLQTRLAINLKKAQHLLNLFQNQSTKPEVPPDTMSVDTTPDVTATPLNLAQHYLKSAEVIERLQEYAFQYAALTFWEKRAASEKAEETDAKGMDVEEADPYEQYLSTAEFVGGKQHRTFYLDSGMQALNVAGLLARHIKAKAKSQAKAKIPLTEVHAYFETAKVRTHTGLSVLRSNASQKSIAAALKGAASADLSPVLVEPLDVATPQRLSSKEHGGEIKKNITRESIPILDITNSPLHDVNSLIVKKSGETRAENFVLVESLTKHSQLGADKYTMGRLVVVGSDTFITDAEKFLQPFADAAHHALLQEFRRNMDEVLYGSTAVELSESWAKNFGDRAETYTRFMTEMGFENPWAAATGQEVSGTSGAMEVEEEKQAPAKVDSRAGWKLLRQAFDKYVKLIVEATGPTSATLEAAFSSLPLSDQHELRDRVERKLLQGTAKEVVSFDDLATENATSTGIQNLGSSCYLAAGLNMLAFSDYFDFFDSPAASVDGEHSALKLTIAGILRDIRAGNLISGQRIAGLLAALNTRGLLPPPSAYAARRGTLATQAQQDPNEVFFGQILDYFSADLGDFKLGQFVRTQIHNRATNPTVAGNTNDRSIPDQYDGYSSNTEDAPTIELEIAGAGSLRNALARLLQTEADPEVTYIEPGGNGPVLHQGSGTRTRNFGDQTPRALTISLKRWKPDLKKDASEVDMPQRFVLNGAVYRLDAVVYHHGRRATEGHYTASTRSRVSGAWQYRDDRVVADDLDFARRSPHGYLFTYSREGNADEGHADLLDIRNPGPYVPPPVIPANVNEGGESGREGTSSGKRKGTSKKSSNTSSAKKRSKTTGKRKQRSKADKKKTEEKTTEDPLAGKAKGRRKKKRKPND